DYFYGNYKPTKGSGSVENFLDYWKSTDKYVKEKKLPTIADAEDFGLELKNQNPITNLRQEMQAMAHRVGLMRLKTDNEAKQVGYMVAREGASVDQLQTWKKINDPVFNGYLFSPEYAKFVNNLIATNKISSNLFLKGLRQASFTFQQIKFFGSLYHLTNISKAAISDNPVGVANPSGYWQLLKSFKPVNKTDPQYKEYINLGGGHKYSIESAAEGQMMKALDKAGRGNYLGALLRLPVGIMQQKFIPASPGMIKWMFEDYIPAIKYNKFQQQVSIKQRQVKRELTDAEKIRIIKDNNNFYGEMNERLFGRSGTVTSALRLIFTAPSYGEGNFRTIFRAIPEKGHGRAAQFIYSSLLTSLVLGVVGTVIATGKWPDVPKKLSDVRDLWKIKTNLKDGNGDTVYFDQMGYAADYWSILGNMFTGQFGNIPGALTQRFAGMVASGAKLMTDLATLSEGNMVYDYKGTPMFLRTDDFTTKFSKFLQYEGLAIAPISTGTFQKSSQSGTNWLSSFFIAASGQKPTTSEAVKLTKASVQDLYALQTGKKNQQTALDKLYNENPPEAINQAKAFNRAQLTKIKQILHSQGATSISLSMLKQNYLITKLYKGAPKEGTTLKNMLQRQP
ncbi:MAG: hypothetical protein KGI08_03440, partial [Thaumarchaeota archaeon]|nr:hypothetical protein [Nitrososphaerota archaeon]